MTPCYFCLTVVAMLGMAGMRLKHFEQARASRYSTVDVRVTFGEGSLGM